MELSLVQGILLGSIMGFIFGFALEKSKIIEPRLIIAQMQLTDFTMIKVFLSAVVTGLVTFAIMNGAFGIGLHPKSTIFGAQIIGGSLLGIGLVIAGACPGTVLGQIGAGYKDAWLTFVGGLIGALTFSYSYPLLKTDFLKADLDKYTLNTAVNLPFWVVAIFFAVIFTAILILVEKKFPTNNLAAKN